jgi:hypothetical protein
MLLQCSVVLEAVDDRGKSLQQDYALRIIHMTTVILARGRYY